MHSKLTALCIELPTLKVLNSQIREFDFQNTEIFPMTLEITSHVLC